MKRKTLALLLCAALLLTACASPPVGTAEPPTTEPTVTAPPAVRIPATVPQETTPVLHLYPKHTQTAYKDIAQELPDHIYTTTGSENGLSGTVYIFDGTVTEHFSANSNGLIIEMAKVETDRGTVLLMNYYKTVHTELSKDYSEAAVKSQMPYSVTDFVFPDVGETAKFVAIYNGFSNTEKAPAFYYGANDVMFDLLELPDPVQPTANTEPDSTLGTKENPYLEGMYKVGVDIPAGEYLFVITDTFGGYVCVSADSNQDDIIENELVELCWFATVEDGQYLEVRDCAFVHADRATLNINADGSFNSGMYRVGIDIPAGEYKLTAEDDGYWCIYKNSELPLDIVSNDLFESSAYVTVKEGQYLKTSNCIAVPVK